MEKSFLDFKVFIAPDINEINFSISGDNQKNVLVGFINENDESFTAFLSKIMSAVKLNLETDCLILKTTQDESVPSFAQLTHQNTFQTAILFGISPSDLGLKITSPPYFTFNFNDCNFLFVEKLSIIQSSDEKKRALWNCLKMIFG